MAGLQKHSHAPHDPDLCLTCARYLVLSDESGSLGENSGSRNLDGDFKDAVGAEMEDSSALEKNRKKEEERVKLLKATHFAVAKMCQQKSERHLLARWLSFASNSGL